MIAHAKVHLVDGLTMAGMAESKHWLTLDTVPEYGGNNGAPLPLEALLISAGSCLGMFIAGMFRKHQKNLARLVIDVVGEKSDGRVLCLTKLTLTCSIVSADADQVFLTDILAKAPERCPVLVTLGQGLKIIVQGEL